MATLSATTVCSLCGQPLNPETGCLACLLRDAIDESEEVVFGDFEIARGDDGSLWELGHGAMGVTYRARDKALHRNVALKVIEVPPAPGGAHAVRERFVREARAAAALRHPNVAEVFHFGTSLDRCYYAMELVEGETLEARVRREGPLSAEAALEIAIQVAQALLAAAARGLIHRDLKPANIMLTPSEAASEKLNVKVIDFGLAKAISGGGHEMDLTHGGFVGTPAFASPEQFAGEPADARSDIYSLGATLWYALTGEVPFPGKGIEEIRHRQTAVALPVEQLAARKVPPPVITLLQRALALDPAARPAAPRELLNALEACRAELVLPDEARASRARYKWAALLAALAIVALTLFVYRSSREKATAASLPEQSIAVLPFDNRSEEKENAFFADGMQDDVLTSLIKIKELKVIGRSSVTSYRDGTKRHLREIGRQLGVAHVLEGSVRRVADRVLIHVNLTDTRDGRAVWAERYDRTLADSIGLQGEVAIEIAVALRTKLAPEEKTRLSEKPTNNPEAYALYLKGLAHERASVSNEDIIAADQLYGEAIALDPKFALAHARASIVNSRMYHFGRDFGLEPVHKSKARMEADEALRLSPTLGEAHLALAVYFYSPGKDYRAGLKEFSIAATALPNDPEIPMSCALIYRRQNRWREALASFERAQDLDPRNIVRDIPRTYEMVRDWAGAAAAYRRMLEIDHDCGYAMVGLAWLEVFRNSDPAAARALMQKIPAAITPDWAMFLGNWDLSMLARDFPAAEKTLAGYTSEELPWRSQKAFMRPAPPSQVATRDWRECSSKK